MAQTYHVEVQGFETLQEVPNAWTPKDYAALLDEMDFDDRSGLADTELREICLMFLQDQDPACAAYIVLKHVIGSDLSEGQLRNMSNEMRDEKLWEEYVDPSFHGRLFTVGSLLFVAAPGLFPKAEAVSVKLRVSGVQTSVDTLLIPTPDAPFLVRLLAGGMDDHAILNRLYEEQIKGEPFANAADLIWSANATAIGNDQFEINVLSSGYWLAALERTEFYDVAAFADAVIDE